MNGAVIARQVIIEGRVQGVGYRAWTSGNATKRGLVGWVRNRADGTVEAVFQGDESTVKTMIESCWDGPLVAKVTAVHVQEYAVDTSRSAFQRLSTE